MAAVDIVPELQGSVQRYLARDEIRKAAQDGIREAIARGTATQTQVHDFAQTLGESTARAVNQAVKPGILPGGRMYWNIGNRLITPELNANFSSVQEIGEEVQRTIDEQDGIGLTAQAAELPENRIRGIADKLAEAEDFEAVRDWMNEAITNCSESFFDDWVYANADFRFRAGMDPKIIRRVRFGCCQWCANLAGTYDYEAVRYGTDVFRRHLYCRCTVTYESGRGTQSVWSKKRWEATPKQMEQRRTIGAEVRTVNPELLEEASELLRRDEETARLMRERGLARAAARRRITNRR